MRGFWRGYFAMRAAPLGPVGAGVVTALFHGFAPRMVARAVPEVWSMAAPEVALQARQRGAVAALQTHAAPLPDPAELAWAVQGPAPGGRRAGPGGTGAGGRERRTALA